MSTALQIFLLETLNVYTPLHLSTKDMLIYNLDDMLCILHWAAIFVIFFTYVNNA